MKTKFCYGRVTWDKIRSEIRFDDAYLSSGFKRFEVSKLSVVVLKNEKLYLCKVKIQVGKHIDETFKFFVLDDLCIKNFSPDDIQLVGYNRNGSFVFDKDFAEGMATANPTRYQSKMKEKNESSKFVEDS